MLKLKLLPILGLLTTLSTTANASIVGLVTAAPANIKISAELKEVTANDKTELQLIITSEVSTQTENCPVALATPTFGTTTPKNYDAASMKTVNFLALWHGRKCALAAQEAKSFLPNQKTEINFFEQMNMPTDKIVELLKKDNGKVSICFQPGEGYECSKAFGYSDLENKGKIQIYPLN